MEGYITHILLVEGYIVLVEGYITHILLVEGYIVHIYTPKGYEDDIAIVCHSEVMGFMCPLDLPKFVSSHKKHYKHYNTLLTS